MESPDELQFAWSDLEAEIREGDYPLSVEPGELSDRERRLVQVGAMAAMNFLPAAPEFQIRHDTQSCSKGVVRGYVKDDPDNPGEKLELECLSCGDTWTTNMI